MSAHAWGRAVEAGEGRSVAVCACGRRSKPFPTGARPAELAESLDRNDCDGAAVAELRRPLPDVRLPFRVAVRCPSCARGAYAAIEWRPEDGHAGAVVYGAFHPPAGWLPITGRAVTQTACAEVHEMLCSEGCRSRFVRVHGLSGR